MSFYKEVPGRQTTLESVLKFDLEPTAGSTNPVTSDGVKGAIEESGEHLTPAVENLAGQEHDEEYYTIYNPVDTYEVGKFYYISSYHGAFLLCISYSASRADFQLFSAVEAINYLNGLADMGSKTEDDLVAGAYTVERTGSHTAISLTTVAAMTVNANPGLGNFEMLIDNSGNTNDVTITVKSNDGQTTYLHSSAAGTDVAAGKIAQLTCVGTCWTLAEFEAPTP